MTLRSENGFTLVELLVSIVISAIIFGVITEAMIVGLRTTDSTDQRVRESVDAQLAAAYFARDAEAATLVYAGDTTPSCGGANAKVSFSWADPATGVAKRVSYVLNAPGGGEQLLTRWSCQTGQASTSNALGRFVGATSVSCDSAAPPCTGTPVSPTPRSVSLTLTETSGAYSYTLSGTRRQS